MKKLIMTLDEYKDIKKRKIKVLANEKDTQKAILDYLNTIGAVAIKIYNGGIFNPKNQRYFFPYQNQYGVSDIIACYKGKFIAIEVKSPGRKPTEFQLEFLERVKKSGGVAIWTDNIDDAINTLSSI